MRVFKLWHRSSSQVVKYPWSTLEILRDIQTLTGHSPGQPAVANPAQAGALDQMVPSRLTLSV